MSIVERVKQFLQSPNGRRMTEQGRRLASDPRNREKVASLLARLRRR